MHRIIRLLPGGQMASGVAAVVWRYRQSEVVVDVAIRAGHDFTGRCHLVRIRQRETRGTVIKNCASP